MTVYFVGDIIAGSAAERSELNTGDRIVSINGIAVTGKENEQVLGIVRVR